MNPKQEKDKFNPVKTRFDKLIAQKKANLENNKRIRDQQIVLKKCAEEALGSSNGIKVMKYLFNYKHACNQSMDINPNLVIFHKGINKMYSKIRELLSPQLIYKIELKKDKKVK